MTIATSKTWRAHVSLNMPTMDAAGPAFKNKIAEFTMLMGGNAPYNYQFYWFIGDTVPDGTDYADADAPIGSMYTRLIITSGLVTGSLLYVKTAAATWTAQS